MKTAPIPNSTLRGRYRTARHYQPRTWAEDDQERAHRGFINGLRLAIPVWVVLAALVALTQWRWFGS